MTEPQQQHQQQQPAQEPTPAQAVEIGGAVGQAAQGAESPEQARERGAQAARATAEKLNVELSEDHVKQIADGLVNELERRGAFEAPPEPVTAPPAAPPAPAASPEAAAAAAAAAQPAPRKRTFAERFLGE